MAFNKKELPIEAIKLIDKTIEALEKKCLEYYVFEEKPLHEDKMILISKKLMMEQYDLCKNVKQSYSRLAWYFYHKGRVDGIDITETHKESRRIESREMVVKFESKINWGSPIEDRITLNAPPELNNSKKKKK
jgi:hypothetical protein